jgi:hypothetical protein
MWTAFSTLAVSVANGGFTLTHLPLPESITIYHGDACAAPSD